MLKNMKSCLIAFVKAPIPGQVKTRLIPFLSAQTAAELYKAFLLDLSRQIRSTQCDIKAVAYTPSDSGSEAQIKELLGGDFEFFPQSGAEDLGQRLKEAAKWGFERQVERLLLVGSDSPTLPNAYIHQAFKALENSEVVIGPSFDGGYYLVGLSKQVDEMFEGICWSTSQVLTQSLQKVEKLKLKLFLLPPWYDVDQPEKLVFLKSHLKGMWLANQGEIPTNSFNFVHSLEL
jgi:rSAM/selenodomain-associated transferase 1